MAGNGYSILTLLYAEPKTLKELENLGINLENLEKLVVEEKLQNIDKTAKCPIYHLTPLGRKYVESMILEKISSNKV